MASKAEEGLGDGGRSGLSGEGSRRGVEGVSQDGSEMWNVNRTGRRSLSRVSRVSEGFY